MDDDILSGASGSVRQFFSNVRARQRSASAALSPESSDAYVNGGVQYLRSHTDPRFRASSLRTAQDFGRFSGDAAAAADAPYGSIASRNDPNRYGSIASREFAGQFGPTGELNPAYRAERDDSARQAAADADEANGTRAALLNGQATASFLQPMFAGLLQGMQRMTPSRGSTSPTSYLDDNEGEGDGRSP